MYYKPRTGKGKNPTGKFYDRYNKLVFQTKSFRQLQTEPQQENSQSQEWDNDSVEDISMYIYK